MNRDINQSFLCNRCKAIMCEDCISIAEEYQQLEQNRKRSMMHMEEELEKSKAEAVMWKRRAEMYHEVSLAGIPDIISAWMDKNFDKLLKTKNTGGADLRGA